MDTAFIQRLTKIVEANLANKAFGIEDVVKEMGMSHSKLHRKLKSISNQAISQFIRELRLKKAREQLLHEDLTVSEISYRVGFGSPTYFNRCFHEYYGISPGELKARGLNHEQIESKVKAYLPRHGKTKKLVMLLSSVLVLILVAIFFIIKGAH